MVSDEKVTFTIDDKNRTAQISFANKKEITPKITNVEEIEDTVSSDNDSNNDTNEDPVENKYTYNNLDIDFDKLINNEI